MAEIVLFTDVNGAPGVSRYAGTYRVASQLRSAGYDVQVVDFYASFTPEQILKIIDAHVDRSTLFAGFSATLWTKHLSSSALEQAMMNPKKSLRSIIVKNLVTVFPHDKDTTAILLNAIRVRSPSCKIVVGGYKATNYNTPGVDFWVLGQGEGPAVAIANHLSKGTPLDAAVTPWGSVVTDKLYPFPGFSECTIDWHPSDHLFPGEHVPIETARGCIFKCSFCAFDLNGKKFMDYTKDKGVLRDELIRNYERFGIQDYMISDDTLNDSETKVGFLHEVFTSLPFQPSFSAYARLDVLRANMSTAPMLREMGLRSVEFGIETMNAETGRYIGKLGDRSKIIETLHELKELWGNEVYMAAGFIIGLPKEPRESINSTIDWLFSDNNPLSGVQMTQYWYHMPPSIPFDRVSDDNLLLKAGFRKHTHGWVYQNTSKIFNDPKKYGYSGDSEIKSWWQNEHFSTDDAAEIENAFYDDPRCRQKRSMSVFQYYNRMRNLGYSHEEVGTLYFDDVAFLQESTRRREAMKDLYFGKIT